MVRSQRYLIVFSQIKHFEETGLEHIFITSSNSHFSTKPISSSISGILPISGNKIFILTFVTQECPAKLLEFLLLQCHFCHLQVVGNSIVDYSSESRR